MPVVTIYTHIGMRAMLCIAMEQSRPRICASPREGEK